MSNLEAERLEPELKRIASLSKDELRDWLKARLLKQDVEPFGDARQGDLPHYVIASIYTDVDRDSQRYLREAVTEFLWEMARDKDSCWHGESAHALLMLAQKLGAREFIEPIRDMAEERSFVDLDATDPTHDTHRRLLQSLAILRWQGNREFWREQFAIAPERYASVTFAGLAQVALQYAIDLLPKMDWESEEVQDQMETALRGLLPKFSHDNIGQAMTKAMPQLTPSASAFIRGCLPEVEPFIDNSIQAALAKPSFNSPEVSAGRRKQPPDSITHSPSPSLVRDFPGDRKSLVIIPAYNEAENIGSVIAEIRSLHAAIDIVVVDDGSADATAQIAERAGVKVLRLPFNLGYGAAVQTGLLYSVENGYDVCVLIDGDGQHDPQYIPQLLAPVAAGEADLALGSRFLGKADYPIPLGRRLGISLFRKLASWFTRQQITDPTSGFQAIHRRLMRFFVNDNYPHDYPDADTLIRLYFAGFRIREVPVTIRPRLRGQSMHSGAKTLYYIYKMLFSIFIALTQKRMLRQGDRHAASDQNHDGHSEPARAADDHPVSTTQTAR